MALPVKVLGDTKVGAVNGPLLDSDPHVQALATGGFVIGMTHREGSAANPNIYLPFFGASGVWQFSPTNGQDPDVDELDISIAGMSDGSVFYAWQSKPDSTGNADIMAARYDPTGASNIMPFTVNSVLAGNQVRPEVIELSGGNVAVAWIDSTNANVRVRIFSSTGAPQTNDITINDSAAAHNGGAFDLGMTALGDNLFLVSWRTNAFDIKCRILNGVGNMTAEFDASPSAGFQGTVAAAALADGRYVVTFFDTDGGNGQYATILSMKDIVVDRFLVAETTGQMAVAGLLDGRFIVAYEKANEIFGRVMNADGTASSGEFIVNTQTTGTQSQPSLDVLADGRVVIAWSDANSGAGDIVYTIYDPRENGVVVEGTANNDDFVGSAFKDSFYGDSGSDILRGGGGDDLLFGGSGNDYLEGGEGYDTLDGGGDGDLMRGGNGNDAYWISGTDAVVDETGASGIDQILSYISFDLGGPQVAGTVENLGYYGDDDASLFGNAANNFINGGSNNDLIRGRAGNDELSGNDGDDTIEGESDDDNLYGGEGNDRLDGDAGDDFLDGGTGSDFMKGGSGDDIYVIDHAADYIEEEDPGDGGVDEVRTFISFHLGDSNIANGDFELLRLMGTADIDGLGSEIANFIEGNAGNNSIHGGGGNDRIEGEAGNDVLEGGDGADHMEGGTGNDTYLVQDTGDVVDESNGSGIDTVKSLISFSLSSSKVKGSVEHLTLQLSAANGTGNALDNHITGNGEDNQLRGANGDDTLMGIGGNDLLDGGAGNDLMQGGNGDDTYVVASVGDVVDETGTGGIDTVRSSTSFSLSSSRAKGAIEHLTLLDGAKGATGNTLANIITGNAAGNKLNGLGGKDVLKGRGGNDVLDGGGGADLMQGGSGNDAYLVDRTGDIVDETLGSGIDTVRASIAFSLASSLVKGKVENLTLLDGAKTGAGNALDNVVTGNGAGNVLRGLAGNDTLHGLNGDDVLEGGGGADTLRGGKGSDTASYADAARKVTANLRKSEKNKGDAQGDRYASVENLTGSSFADTLTGSDGANKLKGGKGSDKLIGGKGADALTGNVGADTFIFASLADSSVKKPGRDLIADFSRKDGDRIDLSLIDAVKASKTSDQAFEFIGRDAFTGKAGELRYEKLAKKTFVYGDVNGDAKPDFAIEFASKLTLKAMDFVL